jgi:AraC-like DNA-binding protein
LKHGFEALGGWDMRQFLSSRYMKEEFPFWVNRSVQGSIEEHGHDFVELVYIVKGRGLHRFKGIDYDIQSGDVFIINPGETHAYILEEGERMEIVNCLFMPSFITDTWLRELEISDSMDYFYVHPFLTSDTRFNHRLNLYGQDAASVLELLDNMIREIMHKSKCYRTIIRLQLIELLLLLSRYYSLMQAKHSVVSPRQLDGVMISRRVYGYLERNFDSKITLQSLADLFNLSTRHLNRLMRQEFGKSTVDILQDIRIGRAKQLLKDSDVKVITVAMMVGYEDSSFFSKLFYRHTGYWPNQYRTGLMPSTQPFVKGE